MKRKHYLITGGLGYIGQNLYWKNWVKNIYPNCDFTICDYDTVLPPAHKLERVHLSGYDGVIHLAALSGIFACEENPSKACLDNIISAGNVFNLATEMKIPVVFTSSQAAKTPHTSIYATVKWAVETLAEYFNKEENGKIYVVRLANVYGGDFYLEKKQTCIKQFITKYNKGLPLEIHGSGRQLRDFVHVWDVCQALYSLIDIQPEYFKPIDIGTGRGLSISDVAKMFPEHTCELVDGRNTGAESSIADISIAEEVIGFRAKRELKKYIKEMV